MESNRIGIITYYYQSTNYGGNLQAYALVSVINNLGGTAVQIAYDYTDICNSNLMPVTDKKKKLRNRLLDFVWNIKNGETHKAVMNHLLKKPYRNRTASILKFNKAIPHTNQVYNNNTIQECNLLFDVFVTGSDMVWYWPNDAFFLTFTDKPKISYAAGISRDSLPSDQCIFYQKYLQEYTAISVRDECGLRLLQSICNAKIEHLLDPTLLLSPKEWDQIASDRIISESYVFCYFLGDSKEIKKLACEFAKRNRLKIVTIADFKDCNNSYLRNDRVFDKLLFDISPNDFVSLIKYAKYVFTDSFHGMAFSIIYQKQFFAFERVEKVGLLGRLIDLAKVLDCENRICCGEMRHTIEYLQGLEDYNYTLIPREFYHMRNKSLTFIRENIMQYME